MAAVTAAFKQQMLAWLASHSNQTMLFQQLMGQSGDISQAGGQHIAGMSANYYNNDVTLSPEPFGSQGNSSIISWWNQGGMAWCSGFNIPSPSTGRAESGYLNVGDWFTGKSNADGSAIINTGSGTHKAFVATLDQIAGGPPGGPYNGGFGELVANGVVFGCRLLHELSGSWWWWGPGGSGTNGQTNTGLTGPQFIAVWRFMYDYFGTTHGFANNMIRIWAVNGNDNVPDRYPGSAYVDMTGFSYYAAPPDVNTVKSCVANLQQYGKPIAWAEWGGNSGESEMDLVNVLQQVSGITYVEQWSQPWNIGNMSNVAQALGSGRVLMLPNLNRPKLGAVPVKPSANDTVVGAGQTITDSLGNVWGISPSGQTMINGVTDPSTSGTKNLAYVNGVVWQENSAGNWWSNPSAQPNAWQPPTGTGTTSPLPAPTPTPAPAPTPKPTPTPSVTVASVLADLDTLKGLINPGNHKALTQLAKIRAEVPGLVS